MCGSIFYARSGARRVGIECRCRWSAYHYTENLKEIFENSNDYPIIKLCTYESVDNDASRK